MEPVGLMPHSQGLSNNSYPEPIIIIIIIIITIIKSAIMSVIFTITCTVLSKLA